MLLKEQEKTLRKYLLGDLSDEEQEALELWLMSEEDAYDLISAAEDDLIDESIAGTLSGRDLERFNNHFLTAAARKRKLVFSQTLQKYVGEEGAHRVPQQAPPPFSFWDIFRYKPAFAYAASALLVVIVGSAIWNGLRLQELQKQLTVAEAQVSAERQAFKQQLDESVATRDRLQSNFRALEQAVEGVKSAPSQALVTIALVPGFVRTSATPIRQVDLSQNTRLFQFSLPLVDDSYDSYLAVVVDGDGKEVWTRDGLPSQTVGEDKAVLLMVPKDHLTRGDFTVRLSGRAGPNPPVSVDSYLFRAIP